MEALLALMPRCDVAIDMGCDHGILTEAMLARGLCGRVIATDVSAPSLAKCRRRLEKMGFGARADFRCGDGFSVIRDGEARVCVLAGMGPQLIARILAQPSARAVETFLLQATCRADELRSALCALGLCIEAESIVRDAGRFYFSMRVCRGVMRLSGAEIAGGVRVRDGAPELLEYLLWQRRVLIRALRGAEGREDANARTDSGAEERLDEGTDSGAEKRLDEGADGGAEKRLSEGVDVRVRALREKLVNIEEAIRCVPVR